MKTCQVVSAWRQIVNYDNTSIKLLVQIVNMTTGKVFITTVQQGVHMALRHLFFIYTAMSSVLVIYHKADAMLY